jgi:hypothetical protein
MKVKNTLVSISLLCGAVLANADTAKAAGFVSNISYTNPESDVILNSITQNGTTFNNFSFVNRAVIQYNTPKNNKDSNSGAASTDRGDNAFAPLLPKEDPTAIEIAAFLGNNNLNNIIDTEDNGAFTIDVFFDNKITLDNSGLDNLFFWERGMNSDLKIQALDAVGNLIGNIKKISETRNSNNYAGFKIDTTEIGDDQKVGSWGVSLNELGVTQLSGLRLTAYNTKDEKFNGPDFKLIARNSENKKEVPEPATIFGLGAVSGMAFLRRRQRILGN